MGGRAALPAGLYVPQYFVLRELGHVTLLR